MLIDIISLQDFVFGSVFLSKEAKLLIMTDILAVLLKQHSMFYRFSVQSSISELEAVLFSEYLRTWLLCVQEVTNGLSGL